jgi:hypothetical protein
MCETNPIWPARGRARAPAGKRCETNPICPAVPGGMGPQGRGTRGKCAKRSQFAGVKCAKRTQFAAGLSGTRPGGRAVRCCTNKANSRRAGPLRQTKPIPGGAGRDGAWGTGDERQMRKTNPIRYPVSGNGCGPAGAGPPAGPDCAKQTQFARRYRVGRGQRSVGRGANAQNEPNFRRPEPAALPFLSSLLS